MALALTVKTAWTTALEMLMMTVKVNALLIPCSPLIDYCYYSGLFTSRDETSRVARCEIV